jgi:hypothetical protein
MNNPTVVKVARLAANLVSHPRYIGPYLSNYISPRSPVDLELPWFSYSAIRFLDKTVKPDMLVYEYGSGGSTLYFSKRCARVVSVEDNSRWFERVGWILHRRNITNADLRFAPADLTSIERFRASVYPDALPRELADIIVVDGSEESIQIRPVCFEIAESRVKPGGMIIVDDSWRYTHLRQRNRAKRVQIYQSVGPARPGVTSTDIFFY